MAKKLSYILLLLILCVSSFSFTKTAEAATVYKGTFVEAIYNDSKADDGSTKKELSKIKIKNNSGKTITLNIDNKARFLINNTVTTIDGFVTGMKVEATVNLRKVSKLSGVSEANHGTIEKNSKQKSGTVTEIDPNGMYIVVKLDGADEKTYYINKNTKIIKDSSTTNISSIYEGDRVTLKFSNTTTSVVSQIDVASAGVLIKNIYKADLLMINTSTNKMTVQNAQSFENWTFGTSKSKALKTFTFTNNTPIYAGNTKITKNDLRNYRNKEVYFVTVDQFGQEVIKQIVALENYERTYYEPMTAVNPAYDFVNLETSGRIYYHDGTILVRNGRLIEPTTLVKTGTAFVVTDGLTNNHFAHVINVTNDSLSSPNLAKQNLYFGKISLVDGYLVELTDLLKLDNNYWKSATTDVFSISNSTNAVMNNYGTPVDIIPNIDLISYEGSYGYFYIKEGHISAIHLLQPFETMASKVVTGEIQSVDSIYPAEIDVKNISQWSTGSWIEAGSIQNMNIDETLIIKNGRVIEASELKVSDRVVLFTSSTLDCHVIFVNE